jgi:hypothetical protein
VIDEILGFLARATRDRRLADKLCASWDSTWNSTSAQASSEQASSEQASSEQASSEQAPPPFSLFGTARDGEFWPLLRGTRIRGAKAGQGAGREFIDDLFSRFLIFESAGWAPAEQSPSIPDPRFGCEPEGVAQPDDSNARFETQLNDRFEAQLNDRFEGAVDVRKSKYLKRVPEHAIRLATIRAVGRAGHRAKVDAADMVWGADLALALVTSTMKRARGRPPVRTARGVFAEKIVDHIVQCGSVTEQELYQYVGHRYSIHVVTNILAQAITARKIIKTLNGYAAAPPSKK